MGYGGIDVPAVLRIVKARLNRRDSLLDDELTLRILAVVREHERLGIRLTDNPDDMMYVADYAAWAYSNRDKRESMPEWLRLRRRELWINQARD